MRNRKLRLAKETLSPLDSGQLRSVVGGHSHLVLCFGIECDYTFCPDCLNDLSFEHCPTPTLPIENCI